MSDQEQRLNVLRQRASVLRAAAADVSDPAQRQKALDLAVEWDRLAKELEAQTHQLEAQTPLNQPGPNPTRPRLGL